jgi:hypothetical protein
MDSYNNNSNQPTEKNSNYYPAADSTNPNNSSQAQQALYQQYSQLNNPGSNPSLPPGSYDSSSLTPSQLKSQQQQKHLANLFNQQGAGVSYSNTQRNMFFTNQIKQLDDAIEKLRPPPVSDPQLGPIPRQFACTNSIPNNMHYKDRIIHETPMQEPFQLFQCKLCSKLLRKYAAPAHFDKCQLLKTTLQQQNIPFNMQNNTGAMNNISNGVTPSNAEKFSAVSITESNSTAPAAPGKKRKQAASIHSTASVSSTSSSSSSSGSSSSSDSDSDAKSTKKRGKLKKKGGKSAAKAPKASANPLDDLCGVVDNGLPCKRPLNCGKHAINLKKAVLGRSMPWSKLWTKYRAAQQAAKAKKNKESSSSDSDSSNSSSSSSNSSSSSSSSSDSDSSSTGSSSNSADSDVEITPNLPGTIKIPPNMSQLALNQGQITPNSVKLGQNTPGSGSLLSSGLKKGRAKRSFGSSLRELGQLAGRSISLAYMLPLNRRIAAIRQLFLNSSFIRPVPSGQNPIKPLTNTKNNKFQGVSATTLQNKTINVSGAATINAAAAKRAPAKKKKGGATPAAAEEQKLAGNQHQNSAAAASGAQRSRPGKRKAVATDNVSVASNSSVPASINAQSLLQQQQQMSVELFNAQAAAVAAAAAGNNTPPAITDNKKRRINTKSANNGVIPGNFGQVNTPQNTAAGLARKSSSAINSLINGPAISAPNGLQLQQQAATQKPNLVTTPSNAAGLLNKLPATSSKQGQPQNYANLPPHSPINAMNSMNNSMQIYANNSNNMVSTPTGRFTPNYSGNSSMNKPNNFPNPGNLTPQQQQQFLLQQQQQQQQSYTGTPNPSPPSAMNRTQSFPVNPGLNAPHSARSQTTGYSYDMTGRSGITSPQLPGNRVAQAGYNAPAADNQAQQQQYYQQQQLLQQQRQQLLQQQQRQVQQLNTNSASGYPPQYNQQQLQQRVQQQQRPGIYNNPAAPNYVTAVQSPNKSLQQTAAATSNTPAAVSLQRILGAMPTTPNSTY